MRGSFTYITLDEVVERSTYVDAERFIVIVIADVSESLRRECCRDCKI